MLNKRINELKDSIRQLTSEKEWVAAFIIQKEKEIMHREEEIDKLSSRYLDINNMLEEDEVQLAKELPTNTLREGSV